jgi:hypothetical protein
VVIGRGFADGYAEIRMGRTGERHYVPITDVPRVIGLLLG